jgi:hypothetical protein
MSVELTDRTWLVVFRELGELLGEVDDLHGDEC